VVVAKGMKGVGVVKEVESRCRMRKMMNVYGEWSLAAW
jgi:hypothetical protein